LRLAGPLYDDAYFAREVAPLLGEEIEYVGALDRVALWRLLGSARATLLPVRWNEPFGLVALESLATGTPVIAYARGGLREIVVDARSGYLVAPDEEDALALAARRIDDLDRAACRADASRYGLPAMLDAHERLYAAIRA
jgi:glycosyltransferase involved in cell wall biosynthesis